MDNDMLKKEQRRGMKISVVIPAYNEELFLPRILQSLKQQSLRPFEVIVVDNNSTDNTASVAKSFGARVVFEKDRGFANACNKGFYAAKGDIIARADADYVVPKNWLQMINSGFQKDKKLIALGGPLYPLESKWWKNLIYYPSAFVWLYILMLFGRGFLFPNIAVKRKIFLKTGGWNTKLVFGEDQDMCVELKKLGKVQIDPNVYVHTSMRRMQSLGLFKLVFGYSIGNQINMWLGRKKFIGLEPVRVFPTEPPAPQKPLFYLLFAPAVIFVSIIGFTISFYTTPVQADVLKQKSKLAISTLKTRVTIIKKTLSEKKLTLLSTPSAN